MWTMFVSQCAYSVATVCLISRILKCLLSLYYFAINTKIFFVIYCSAEFGKKSIEISLIILASIWGKFVLLSQPELIVLVGLLNDTNSAGDDFLTSLSKQKLSAVPSLDNQIYFKACGIAMNLCSGFDHIGVIILLAWGVSMWN